MFLGEYVHSLDNKGRLTIPARFRDQLATGLVVTRNPAGGCLWVMPLDEWQAMAERVSSLPMTDQRSALLRRALFSAAEELKPDKQGRILISQRLRDFAKIDGEVLVAGMNTYIELWNPEEWETQVLSQLADEQVTKELFETLGV
ncbi:MAG: transcriptional regulator MraZ [Caldilineae bacterium]|nr:MAG: transcriptional regulator MraZ [Caldilineae bacterium]